MENCGGFRNNRSQNNINFQDNYRHTYGTQRGGLHGRGHGGIGQGQPPQHNYRGLDNSGFTGHARMVQRQNYGHSQKWGSSNKWEGKFAKFRDPNQSNKYKQRKQEQRIKKINSRSAPNVSPVVQNLATKPMVNDSTSLTSTSANSATLIQNIKKEQSTQDTQGNFINAEMPSTLNKSKTNKIESPNEGDIVAVKIPTLNKIDANPKKEKIQKSPKPSSSSSSTSSEDDCESSCPEAPVVAELKAKRKIPEEDIVCLGKLENKFVVEDDDDGGDLSSSRQSDQCMICDKMDHSSFQCQMICMNCSAPYHNLKSCPKPANLTVMLQSFMEFCMSQLRQFSPQHNFLTAQEGCMAQFSRTTAACIPGLSTLETTVTPTDLAKHKRTHIKSKNIKKTKKKKRRKPHDSDYDEDTKRRDSSVDSSPSDSKTDSSEEIVVAPKAKRAKSSILMPTGFNSSFPMHTGLPEYVSPAGAAAAYNPLLFNQMLNGAFLMHSPMNLNR